MSEETASYMMWHHDNLIENDALYHPIDSLVWQAFDIQHASFSSKLRNVRLKLASDGFNPVQNMSNRHYTWPVLLYNLPP